MSLFHRFCHFKDSPLVKEGDWVKRGDLLGYCGSSGRSSGPHCHYDIFNQRGNWYIYTDRKSLSWVKSVFSDPRPYIKDNLPMKTDFPLLGYGFLQWVRNGAYYHPGIDCNSANDLGAPVSSTVEGRVVFVAGTSWIKNKLKKLIPVNFNHGFGNFVVIEESPDFKL